MVGDAGVVLLGITYVQESGRLYCDDDLLGFGYSGRGVGKNNPSMQTVCNVGPIPCGTYAIGIPIDTVTHGPFVLPLTPTTTNVMFGRAGFLIHGDSVVAPGTASEGCIVVSRDVRERVAASADKTLTVIASLVAG